MKYRPPKLDMSPPKRTKIDERREREEYDRAHPWQAMEAAVINDGVICELLFSDMAPVATRYFLAEDDHWYSIDPPAKIWKSRGWTGQRTPMNWRPAGGKITPEKRASVMRRANREIYSGGWYHGDDPSW